MSASADERLVVMLEARISDFEKRMAKAERTGSDSYRKLRQGSSSATKAMEQDMIRSTSSINQSLASAGVKIGGFGKAFMGGFIGGAAATLLTQAVGRVNEMAKGIASVGDEARRAGMSTRAFQEWKFVAEQNRIGVDALVDGFKELSLRADEFILTGKGSGAEAFQRLGYTAEELKTKLQDPSALMLEIIGRLQQLDKASQIRIADELFGGSGGERFVELLAQGEDGIRRTIDRANDLGVVMSDELIAKADEVNRKFNEISQTVGIVLKSAIVSAAASLADFMDGFREFENQRTGTLQSRQSQIMANRVELTRLLKATPEHMKEVREDFQRIIDEEEAEENQIITHLSQRAEKERWTPAGGEWTPPTPGGVIVPGSGGGGGGKGVTRADLDERDMLAEAKRIYESTRTAAKEYSDELEKLIRLRNTMGKDGEPLIDQEAFERAKKELDATLTQAGRFSSSIADALKGGFEGLFTAIIDGSDSAGEAIENLGKRLAAMAMQEAVFQLLANLMPTTFGPQGFVPLRRARGGHINGPGTGTSDSIPAMLSNGEFVVNAAATRQNRALLEAINSGRAPGFATGGHVGPPSVPAAGRSAAGSIQIVNQTSGRVDEVSTETARGPNGMEMTRIVMKEFGKGTARGMGDKAMQARFGARPTKVRRG